MDTTLSRILELMKDNRVTAYSMENLLEVPHGSFSNWKRGKGKSYYEHIDRIADRLNVSIDYLVRGETADTEAISRREKELVEGFRQLPEQAQNLIMENVRLLTNV